MKNILIMGLGLLGGSYAKGLTKKGYTVKAIEKNPDSVQYAISNGIIVDGSTDVKEEFFKIKMES